MNPKIIDYDLNAIELTLFTLDTQYSARFFMIASPVFVAGHGGMVGSAVCRRLATMPGIEVMTRSRSELDLCEESQVNEFFSKNRPATVIFASAKVGGIQANKTFPVEFLTDNLRQELATIHDDSPASMR